jgi:HK97 family phage major capsid protein
LNIRELRSKRNQILVDMQKLAENGLTAENRSKLEQMNKDVDQLEKDIDLAERTELRLTDERLASEREAAQRPENQFQRSLGRGPIGTSGNERRSSLNRAFQRYFVSGNIEESRSLLTTSDATGGALIPQEFDGVLTEALKFYGPVATRVCQRVTDGNGRPLKLSLADDTANGMTLLATEGTSSPVETDPTFQSKIVGADTISSGLIKVSIQELNDSSFDLDNLIREMFALRYGRGMEKAVTLGTDAAGTQLPNFPVGGLLASATVGVTTATLAGGIGWDDVVNLYAALDPSYAARAVWQMNSTTRAALISMKDGFGRPFWTPSPTEDNPFGKLLGAEVILNQSLPNAVNSGSFVANAKPILFGDLDRSFLLRTDGSPSILRLNERYADTLQIGFLLFSRVGGASLAYNSTPLVALKLAAS